MTVMSPMPAALHACLLLQAVLLCKGSLGKRRRHGLQRNEKMEVKIYGCARVSQGWVVINLESAAVRIVALRKKIKIQCRVSPLRMKQIKHTNARSHIHAPFFSPPSIKFKPAVLES